MVKPARQLADVFGPTHGSQRPASYTFSAYERMSTALTAAQVFGVQRLCRRYARVWRRYTALTPQEAILAGANCTITLVSLPAPLPLSIRRPANSLQRVGLTARDTVLINPDHWVYRFSGAGSGDISSVCRLPVRELLTAGRCSALRGPRFQNRQTIWRPAPVW